MSHDYFRMRSPQIATAIGSNQPVVVCLGAVEQHGTHLPVGTDTIQVEGLARKARDILAHRGIHLHLGPTIPFGPRQFRSEAPTDFPGTIAVTPGLLGQMIREIGSELVRHGFRRIYLLIGNAESDAPSQVAAKELNDETDAVVTTINWIVVSAELNRGNAVFPSPQGHGGAGETSRMMALLPDSVDLTDAKSFFPTDCCGTYKGAGMPYIGGAVGRYKHPRGSFGDFAGIIGAPHEASAATGERLIDNIGSWIADVIFHEESIWMSA